MAISKNTKNKFNKAQKGYTEGNAVANARNSFASISRAYPEYANSYNAQLEEMYGKIKQGSDFNYSPVNDAAYRRFADEYRALAGLAIADNQQQAQGLTGGYGSSYADDVASQGAQRMKDRAAEAQPLFLQQAEKAYMANTDADIDAYYAAAQARDNELKNYEKSLEAYNNQYSIAQNAFKDERELDYNKFSDNRDFWAKQYWNEQEQEDWEKEFKLAKSSGVSSGGRRRGSSKSYNNSYSDNYNSKIDDTKKFEGNSVTDDWLRDHGKVAVRDTEKNIKNAYAKGNLTLVEADFLINYYQNQKNKKQFEYVKGRGKQIK